MEERKSRYELFLEEEARKAQPTKRCSKCGEVKSLGEFYKIKDRNGKDGLRGQCKKCRYRYVRKFKGQEDRFWKLFQLRTKKVGECIEWQGMYHGQYPAIKRSGKRIPVTRMVYQLSIGALTDDDIVLLICNNKRCVRHSHLKLATKIDLTAKRANRAPTGDAHYARRHPEWRVRGDTHGCAKLSSDKVKAIRKLYGVGGITQKELACQFGVSRSVIWTILHRKTWSHVQ